MGYFELEINYADYGVLSYNHVLDCLTCTISYKRYFDWIELKVLIL